jgi:3-oxoacyl-[acyl-carrier-protein] synthase-3
MPESFSAGLVGLGEYRPTKVMSNADICERLSVNADWIKSRSGVERRHHAREGEDIISMAVAAGAAAVSDADLPFEMIDLVVVATASRRRPMPSSAAAVAAKLGIPSPGAFDLNAACAGFSYSLAMAASAICTGTARNVLVIGSEKLTDWTTPDIADTYAIMADGAGAVVVSRSTESGIAAPVWGSDGHRSTAIEMPEDSISIRMTGPAVYRWATSTLPAVAEAACGRAGVQISDIDWFVPHQANARILDAVAAQLGIAHDRVARDVVDTGNTSAASIPMALARLRSESRAMPGDRVLLLGFGSGLTFAGQVVRMPQRSAERHETSAN